MKDKHPILPILQHYGMAEPNNTIGWVKVKCPFHNDRQASATVNQELNVFKCFACEVSGDTYNIIMKHERKSYREAYAIAEEVTGISGKSLPNLSASGRRLSTKSGTNTTRRGYTPPRGGRRASSRARNV